MGEAKVGLKGVFAENDHFRSVEWVYATVDEQGVVSDETFTLAIDLVDSPLTAEFISVMTGQNNYGESGAAISLVDAISKCVFTEKIS